MSRPGSGRCAFQNENSDTSRALGSRSMVITLTSPGMQRHQARLKWPANSS